MQCIELLLENRQHFIKSPGIYPVRSLKKSRFGIRRLFSSSHVIIIASLRLLNKSIYFYTDSGEYIGIFADDFSPIEGEKLGSFKVNW
jgi:hypothetical protein